MRAKFKPSIKVRVHILSWKISGAYMTPIGNLKYLYFPDGVIIVQISWLRGSNLFFSKFKIRQPGDQTKILDSFQPPTRVTLDIICPLTKIGMIKYNITQLKYNITQLKYKVT